MMIMRLHFPEQLTQMERFFLTAWADFPLQSLGCNILEITVSSNNKADSPCVLIIKLSHSLCNHPDSSSTYWKQPVNPIITRRIPFTWFQTPFLYWSHYQIILTPHPHHRFLSTSSSLTSLPFAPPTPPPPPTSSSFNIPSLHWFSSSPQFGIFLSSLRGSILFNSCHTERFCSLSWGSGETLCQTARERKKKRGRQNHCKVAD